ncbi:hypothetical protein G7067_13090 [Leucobacter insecticola]|uniref:Uncharacterized protein n=1 Tax=Leucobacter insecticola TaxID=2714934 RepID=A0A6G8FM19_9MICO|nr:hypothetical protein [Leucobacter insecticola]QIM17132.1 hypothetical protein G7067_13090 [Leucobacter insecticola]
MRGTLGLNQPDAPEESSPPEFPVTSPVAGFHTAALPAVPGHPGPSAAAQ